MTLVMRHPTTNSISQSFRFQTATLVGRVIAAAGTPLTLHGSPAQCIERHSQGRRRVCEYLGVTMSRTETPSKINETTNSCKDEPRLREWESPRISTSQLKIRWSRHTLQLILLVKLKPVICVTAAANVVTRHAKYSCTVARSQ